jgi:uncharacterized protein YcbX
LDRRSANLALPMPIVLDALYRYPVKGLTAESLTCVRLEPGRGIAHDRRFAIAHGATPYDQTEPAWRPKTAFLQLMQHPKLATLESRFEPATGVLTLARDGRTVAHAEATRPIGRTVIDQFLIAYLGDAARGPPRLVEAPESGLMDVKQPVVSIIGRASLADLARVVGRPVEPLRFRANLYLAGAEPWVELGWVGSELTIGGARLRVVKRIARCQATSVNPLTAERDLAIPAALQLGFGHQDMGVYAEVIEPGSIRPGDLVEIRPGSG